MSEDSRKREAIKGEQLKADLAKVISSPEGKRVFRHILLTMAGIHRTTFSTNAMSMASLEGRRSMGLDLEAALINASARDYAQMLTAHITEEANV